MSKKDDEKKKPMLTATQWTVVLVVAAAVAVFLGWAIKIDLADDMPAFPTCAVTTHVVYGGVHWHSSWGGEGRIMDCEPYNVVVYPSSADAFATGVHNDVNKFTTAETAVFIVNSTFRASNAVLVRWFTNASGIVDEVRPARIVDTETYADLLRARKVPDTVMCVYGIQLSVFYNEFCVGMNATTFPRPRFSLVQRGAPSGCVYF